MSKYKIKLKLSGVGSSIKHDGKMNVDYVYVFNGLSSGDLTNIKTAFEKGATDTKNDLSYDNLLQNYDDKVVITNLYIAGQAGDGQSIGSVAERGINLNVKDETDPVSIYRREYQQYSRNNYYDDEGNSLKEPVVEYSTYVGPWEPVVINNIVSTINDYNVKSGFSYQYILYPIATENIQLFANKEAASQGIYCGDPVSMEWDFWTLCELIPESLDIDAPIVKKKYRVDTNNIWKFKYSLETGSQTQNLTKNEVQTLGQFSRISHGKTNNISGEVSCLLGSEIIPMSKTGYIERLAQSRYTPLSTNEKIKMLQQWRNIVYSKNPKLLRDIKGQAWIVSIISGSNSPFNLYKKQPDTITFTWKQIEDVDNVIIYDNENTKKKQDVCYEEWTPVKRNKCSN